VYRVFSRNINNHVGPIAYELSNKMYGVKVFSSDYKNIFTCFGFEVFKLNNKLRERLLHTPNLKIQMKIAFEWNVNLGPHAIHAFKSSLLNVWHILIEFHHYVYFLFKLTNLILNFFCHMMILSLACGI
jgi:hypothetical protein